MINKIIIISLLAATSEIYGLYLVGNKNKFGFILNIICCLLWIITSIISKVYGLSISAGVMLFLNIRNYKKWSNGV